jgi:ATP-binding cassette subfamily C protein CydD
MESATQKYRVAMDLADSEDPVPTKTDKLDRRLSAWLSSLRKLSPAALRVAMAAPIVAGLLLVVQMWALSGVLSGAVAQQKSLSALIPGMAAILGLIVLRAVVTGVGERAASRAAETIKISLRMALFEHMLSRGPGWTRRRVSGELASSLVEQVEALDGFFSRYIPSMMAAAFVPLAFSVLLLPMDWVVGLILLISAPLIPFFMALVGWRAEAASMRHQQALSRLSGFFADRLRGALTLKLFGRVDSEIAVVRDASQGLSRKTMAVLRIAFLSSAVLELFAALGVAGVALYVGLGYLGYLGEGFAGKSLQIGMFCLFLAPEVYSPLRQFAANYHDRAAARAAVGQLADLFNDLPRVAVQDGRAGFADSHSTAEVVVDSDNDDHVDDDVGGAADAVAHAAAGMDFDEDVVVSVDSATNDQPVILQTKGLFIRTPDRRFPVLDDVNLSLSRGQRVALMGASGSGKTSLLETISGWRSADEGTVAFRGRRPMPGRGWTCRDGVVLIGQQVFFSLGTIADHIGMADRSASEHAIWRALDMACVGDVVRALPDGLSTRLGARGYGLSGGQLHRIALARLFMTSPDLILLDEPTAHLDAATRDQVMDGLLAFAEGRVLIVATHDEQVAARMDAIYRVRNRQVQAC